MYFFSARVFNMLKFLMGPKTSEGLSNMNGL